MKKNFSKILELILKDAKEQAIRLGQSYVGSEHLFIGLLNIKTGISSNILDLYDIKPKVVIKMIEDLIQVNDITTLGHLPLTRRAERVLKNAYLEASERGLEVAGSEHLLLAFLREKDGVVFDVLNSFSLEFDTVCELIDGEINQNEETINNTKIKNDSLTPTLDHFSRDITDLAINDKLDPVIGREKEIERVAQVLSRRKKNNPILIGEPGVGKTAIIEGLAQRIINKKAPRVLNNKRILCLDLALIVSGTKYRGQFEERLKNIMKELEDQDNLIIFIDELHTLVGAGGASGSLDASNMFKPSLARGDIHCIGATTLDEHRQFIEKDGALDRRFQKIIINPSSKNESIEILIGLKGKYEEHHNVKYSDDAIEACVYLSDRYISDKYLPDKAIDILDEAGARAHLYNNKTPKNIVNIEKKIDAIRSKKDIMVNKQLYEEAAILRDDERKLIKKLNSAQKLWNKKLKSKVIEICSDNISDVVSIITGIPVNKVAQSESKTLLNLPKTLGNHIIGQDSAINSLSNSIRRSRSGLKDPLRPIGVFLFLGPTGVGKTELAKVLSKYLNNNINPLIKVDMSEFSERFSISRLIGSPPGYVGYNSGGELTEKVRRNPHSVILLDELEKAHPDIFNIFLQIFDDGVLTDGQGTKVDFSNTIIIMTSNLGNKELTNNEFGFGNDFDKYNYDKIKTKIMKSVHKIISPELLNRIDETIIFRSLKQDSILKIINLQLGDLYNNLSRMGIKITISISAKRLLAEKGYHPDYGVRSLRREIQNSIENKISEELLKRNTSQIASIKITAKNKVFIFSYFENKIIS